MDDTQQYKSRLKGFGGSETPSEKLRVMPHSIEAEQAILGAVLRDHRVLPEALELISTAESFYSTKHQSIYQAFLNLFEKSEPMDVTTVADELERLGSLKNIGGSVYLIELVEGIATTANATYYADIVAKKAASRLLIDVSTEIVRRCHMQDMAVEELLDFAENRVFAISESRLKKGFSSMADLVPHTFKEIEDFQEADGGVSGLKSGFDTIDEKTGGFHAGEFIVIAGRPSMGKSAIAMNIAENIAMNGVGVGVFSLEMSKEALALRMICGRARISQHRLRSDKLRESEWARLGTAGGALHDVGIYIDDSGTLSALEMRAKARRLKSQHDIGMIVIDYMQMMSGPTRSENRQQEMSQISRSMKGLAKELKIPVIACSQLSRMVEQRSGGDKRPQLSDLRESGAIEQDADLVMFVYREEYYVRHDDPRFPEVEGQAEIIIAKQRNGPTGTCKLSFVKDYVRFENAAPSYRLPDEAPPAEMPPDAGDFAPF